MKRKDDVMLYLSGIHALNIPCKLNTSGDWHASALSWNDIHLKESDNSIFGDYGIEQNKVIPEHQNAYNVANHIRALLDIISDGNFSVAEGMREDFICNDNYNEEIFQNVIKLHDFPIWDKVNSFMIKEYKMKWINYIKNINNN